MATEYSKKINASLTEDDFNYITEAADRDRRSTAQYASILLEDAIAAKRTTTKVNTQSKGTSNANA